MAVWVPGKGGYSSLLFTRLPCATCYSLWQVRKRARPDCPLKFHQPHTPSFSVPRPCLRQQPQRAQALFLCYQYPGVHVPLKVSPKCRGGRCRVCPQPTAKRWLGRDACPSLQLAESAVARWLRISISIASLPSLTQKGQPSASCVPYPILGSVTSL